MNLRAIREEKGLGLVEFASIVGLSPAYISELERGISHNPTKEIMEKIAHALDRTVPEVFFSDSVTFTKQI
jgi:transcriptional regulator with XRE-family HTH domain